MGYHKDIQIKQQQAQHDASLWREHTDYLQRIWEAHVDNAFTTMEQSHVLDTLITNYYESYWRGEAGHDQVADILMREIATYECYLPENTYKYASGMV